MTSQSFTPKQSLEIISQVISEARHRFDENGFIYIFWGILIALASFGQFFLLQNGRYDIHWYPYLLMPLGAVFTMVYYIRKKSHRKMNIIDRIIAVLWNTLSFYMLILGFVFAGHLKENLLPVILILLSVGSIVSGVTIKSKILLFAGIFIGLTALFTFYVDLLYQPLVAGITAIVALLVPGFFMMHQHKQRNHV